MPDGWSWPDYAQPVRYDPDSTGLPDYAEPVNIDWQPTPRAPIESPSQLGRMWELGNRPYSDFFSRNLKKVGEEFYRSGNENPSMAGFAYPLAAATEAVGPALDTMFLSPLGTASLGASGLVRGLKYGTEAALGINRATASIPAARTAFNLERIGRAIEPAQRALSAGYGVQGAYGLSQAENPQEAVLSGGQAILGALGTRSTYGPREKTIRTPEVKQGEVVPDKFDRYSRQLTSGEPIPPGMRPGTRFLSAPEGEIIDFGPGDYVPDRPPSGISPADSAGRLGRDEGRNFPVQGSEFRPSAPVSAAQVLGTLNPVESQGYDVGEQELISGTNEPESTLRLRIPETPRTGGNITYQRVNGRNVKLIDGVPEDQAAERELIQEPQLQHTPEIESLLRKFFNDESGTMDFDEMRRRFNQLRKGEEISETEKKGVAEFETKLDKETRLSLSTKELQQFLSSETIRSEENTRVRTQIENELRRRGVEPKPDYEPIPKEIYGGWNWEQGEGKTSQMMDIPGADPDTGAADPPLTPEERGWTNSAAEVPQRLKPIAGGRFGELPGTLNPIESKGTAAFPFKGKSPTNLFEITQAIRENPDPTAIDSIMQRADELLKVETKSGSLRVPYNEIQHMADTATDANVAESLQDLADRVKERANQLDTGETKDWLTANRPQPINIKTGQPGKLKPIPPDKSFVWVNGELVPKSSLGPKAISGETTDPYQIAKRNLDERNRRGEVVDYVEELEELNRQHGVIDTMSNEQSKIVDEIRNALDQGYSTLNPKSPDAPGKKRSGWTLAGKLSDGTLVLDYPEGNPHRVGKPYQAVGQEQGIRTRIPNEVPPTDEPASMKAPAKDRVSILKQQMDAAYRAGNTKEVVRIGQEIQEIENAASMDKYDPKSSTRTFRRGQSATTPGSVLNPQEARMIRQIAVREQAATMGINPDQFEHEGDLGQAMIDARIQLTGAAAKLAEVADKLEYYRKIGDIREVTRLTNEIGEVRQQAMRENVQEVIQKHPEILNDPHIADIVDAEKMRVPESTNIALGPRIEGGGRLLDALGTALYRRDRAATWVKEGFQNANDERKITKNTEPIRIVFREHAINPVTGERNKSLIVQDGGRGMNPQQLYTHFSNVGETGKANEVDASGGFGFAKASPFLGGTLMKVISINKENGRTYRHEFQGTPEQFKDQAVGVPINTVQVGNLTKTGFQVEVFYPTDQDFYGARSLIEKTVKNTPGMSNIHVLHDQFGDGSLSQTKKFLEGLPASSAKELKGEPLKTKVATISIPGADVDFHYEVDNIERRGGQLYYLNNGTYALDAGFSAGWNSPTLPGVPGSISVNIKSTVEEGKPGYPFTLNREELQSDTEKPIKDWVNENIIEPAKAKKRDELQHLYDTLPTHVTDTGNRFVVLDSGEKYTPDELTRFMTSKEAHAVANVYTDIMAALTARFDSTWAEFGETEKLGFIIAQQESGGINIPNNRDRLPDGRKKTATMINFLGIATYPSKAEPWETAQGIVHAIGHEFAHNKTRPEDEVTWAIYDLFKKWPLQEQMKYAERIREAITGPDGRYTPEFEDLLQEYTSARGRPVTKEDILSRQTEGFLADEGESSGIAEMADSDSPKRKGTVRGESKPRKYGAPREPKSVGRSSTVKEAAKSAATAGPNRQVPITPETQSIRYPAASIERLKEALRKGNLLRSTESRIQGLERSKRAGMIAGVKTPGTQGYFQKLGMLKGPLPNIPINTDLTQGDIDSLITAVNNSTLMPYSKLSAQDGLMRLFSGRIPNQSQTRLMAKVFGSDLPELIQLHAGIGFSGMGWNEAMGAINIPKSFMSGMDLSFVLRQAAPFMGTKEYWNSFANMWKYFGDEKSFQASQEAIFDDPVFQFFQEFDRPLFISEFKPGTEIARMEENFGSDLASRLPIYKQTGRMQTAFINKLRFDVAKRMLGDMYESGAIEWGEGQGDQALVERKARQDVQALIDFVNNFSGRGNLGRLAGLGPLLNATMFSPSFQMSRAHILASPWNYVIKPGLQAAGMGDKSDQRVPPVVRKEAWKAMTSIVAFLATGVALTNFFGGDVDDDPNSSDWLKGRFGNTRLDFSQGLQPPIVAAHRIATNKSVSPDRLDKSGRLVPGKEYDLGKTFTGPTIGSVIGNFFLNKTSPTGGLANVWARGEQAFPPGGIGGMLFPGKQNMTKAAATNMAMPMMVNDLADYYKDNPNFSPQGAMFAIATLLGIPMQTYDESKMSKNPFERGFQLRPIPGTQNQQQYQQQSPGMLVPPQAR